MKCDYCQAEPIDCIGGEIYYCADHESDAVDEAVIRFAVAK